LFSHTIIDVQFNDDKVSLLLKENLFDSFLTLDMLFMDTPLFLDHIDTILYFYKKE